MSLWDNALILKVQASFIYISVGGNIMAICGIYKITNNLNGKSYIGYSIDIQRRWSQHKKMKYIILKESLNVTKIHMK